MKWMFGFLMVCALGAGLPAATLSYEVGTTNTTYHYRPLRITASHEGTDIWKMALWIPEEGYTQYHDVASPGEIAEFHDLTHGGGTFNYSPEGNSYAWTDGLMRMGGFQGDFSDAGGRQADYYEFTKTHQIEPGLTATLVVRIQAPTVDGANWRTVVSGTHTIANAKGSSYDLWYSGGYAGTGSLALRAGGYTSWPIVNPNDATAKPNVHNTDASDGHPLYTIYDWYGSTVTGAIPGFYAKMVVKDNAETQALGMRPGLTFELRCDNLDYYYVDLNNLMKGSTTVAATAGVECRLSYQAGVFGSGVVLPDGESVSLAWEGIISTTATPIPPIAKAGADFEVIDADDTGAEVVTLEGGASFDPDGTVESWTWYEGASKGIRNS